MVEKEKSFAVAEYTGCFFLSAEQRLAAAEAGRPVRFDGITGWWPHSFLAAHDNSSRPVSDLNRELVLL